MLKLDFNLLHGLKNRWLQKYLRIKNLHKINPRKYSNQNKYNKTARREKKYWKFLLHLHFKWLAEPGGHILFLCKIQHC